MENVMHFTDKEKEIIGHAIRKLERLNFLEKNSSADAFESHEQMKFKAGMPCLLSSGLFIGVLAGNNEIQREIGTLGVTFLPLFIIISAVCLFNSNKRLNEAYEREKQITDPLRELGIMYSIGEGYEPVRTHRRYPNEEINYHRRLWVIDTGEDLSLDEWSRFFQDV